MVNLRELVDIVNTEIDAASRKYQKDLEIISAPLIERRSFIRSFVKEIRIKGDSVIISYTISLTPKGTSQEKIGVLCSVHYGGAGGIRTPYLLTAS